MHFPEYRHVKSFFSVQSTSECCPNDDPTTHFYSLYFHDSFNKRTIIITVIETHYIGLTGGKMAVGSSIMHLSTPTAYFFFLV